MKAAVHESIGSRWRGMSPPDRRAARRRLLLDAAFDLLGTAGWSGTTVRGICHAAQLNPRYFYESFADLDALLLAVFDDLLEAGGLAAAAAVAGAGNDLGARVRAAVATLFHFVTDDPRRARVLFVEANGNEQLMRRRLDTMHAMADLIDASAREIYGDPEPGERINVVAANLLIGGITELLVAWLDGQLDLSLDQLIDDTAALILVTGEGAIHIAAARSARRLRG